MADGGQVQQRRKSGVPMRWDPEHALNMLATGKSIPQIAKELNLHHSTIYEQLLKDDYVERYSKLQAVQALAALDRAEQTVETAPDAHTLARAREAGRFAQWRLERMLRKLYGADAPVGQAAIAITINLSGHSEREPDISIDSQAVDPE